jgi:hypothetical protein
MSVSQKTMSVSKKMTSVLLIFTIENPSRETMSIQACSEARSPLRSTNPPCTNTGQKSPGEKTQVSAFWCILRECSPLQDMPDGAGKVDLSGFHVGEFCRTWRQTLGCSGSPTKRGIGVGVVSHPAERPGGSFCTGRSPNV